jgi:hypothetical protein
MAAIVLPAKGFKVWLILRAPSLVLLHTGDQQVLGFDVPMND